MTFYKTCGIRLVTPVFSLKAPVNLLWVSYPTFSAISAMLSPVARRRRMERLSRYSFIYEAMGVPYTALKTDLRVDVFIRNFLDISSMVNLFSTLSVKKSLISFYKLGLPGNVLGKSGFGRRLKAYKIKQYLLCLKPIIGHFLDRQADHTEVKKSPQSGCRTEYRGAFGRRRIYYKVFRRQIRLLLSMSVGSEDSFLDRRKRIFLHNIQAA